MLNQIDEFDQAKTRLVTITVVATLFGVAMTFLGLAIRMTNL